MVKNGDHNSVDLRVFLYTKKALYCIYLKQSAWENQTGTILK